MMFYDFLCFIATILYALHKTLSSNFKIKFHFIIVEYFHKKLKRLITAYHSY